MTNKSVVIDTQNKSLRVYVDPTTTALLEVHIDTQNTFVCVNDPSECAMSTTMTPIIPAPIQDNNQEWYYLLDVSEIPIDLESDLLFLFCKFKDILHLGTPDEVEVEATNLIVVYNSNALLRTIWNSVKHLARVDCCGDICKHSNMILFKYMFELSMQGRYVRDAIYYWNLMHDSSVASSYNCNCSRG